jgi:hypothetical protein
VYLSRVMGKGGHGGGVVGGSHSHSVEVKAFFKNKLSLARHPCFKTHKLTGSATVAQYPDDNWNIYQHIERCEGLNATVPGDAPGNCSLRVYFSCRIRHTEVACAHYTVSSWLHTEPRHPLCPSAQAYSSQTSVDWRPRPAWCLTAMKSSSSKCSSLRRSTFGKLW